MRTLQLLTAALLLTACTGKDRTPEGTASPTDANAASEEATVELDTDTEGLSGLRIRLTEVERPLAEAGARAPAADAAALGDGQVQSLLRRLPDIEAAERVDFALRKGSPPPPLPGSDVQEAWPPPVRPDIAPDVDPGALSVLRFAPEGEVPLAPHLSVTFSQPMIAVTSQDEASKTVPVELTPRSEGNWRWIGTKTLLFDPDPRLPMATEFTATIPKGTTSALGVSLDEAVRFTFATPPPKVTQFHPRGGNHATKTLLFLAFDQAIDDRMADAVHLRAGSTEVELRPATAEEVEADPVVSAMSDRAQDGRWLAFAPATPLAPATNYRLSVDAGAPSAEGPRTTVSQQQANFRTYDPLRVQRWGCWADKGRCNPDGNLWVRFNNNLVEDDAAERITVSPDLPGMNVQVSGNWVNINGELPARESVTVTVDPALTDSFGQTLGKPQTHTFRIGPASPQLMGPGGEQVVLDPSGPPVFSVYSRNHRTLHVQVFNVGPGDFAKLSEWMREARYDGSIDEPPLFQLDDQRIQVAGYADDELVETALDLAPYLDQGKGHVFVWVQPPNQSRKRWERVDVMAWVQSTDLGLTALVDNDEIQAWVTDLATGAPVEGAQVQLVDAGKGATVTGADGLAKLGKYGVNRGPHALRAQVGNDVALLPAVDGWWNQNGGWIKTTPQTGLRWFTFNDRGMYKPKESARFKGWVRPFTPRPGGGLEAWDGDATLTWTARDSRGAEIAKGSAQIGDLGGYEIELELPESPNLGPANLMLETTWGGVRRTHRHSFQIQEFRRPEYEVTTTVDPRPYVLGQHAVATVEAAYYAGGALPDAETQWQVTATPSSYRPPGHDRFSFGSWSPWWRPWNAPPVYVPPQSLSGKTAGDGTHSVRMDFLAMDPVKPYSVKAQATVVDVNRQRWASSASFLVHPASRYVGLRTERSFVEKGKPIEIQAIVAGIEGDVVVGVPVAITFARLQWEKKDGRWQQVEVDPEPCDLKSAAEAVSCEVEPDVGGAYRITARITDSKGRTNQTQVQVWVSGGKARPERKVTQEEVLLVPAAETYAIGDTAEVLLQAPFFPSEGLVTIRQDGLVSTERITLDGPTQTLSIPIADTFVPNVTLEVDLVGSAERVDDDGEPQPDKPRRVAYASGSLQLKVPPASRTLAVSVEPADDQVDPGAATEIGVTVLDAAGKPAAGAEVAVWMVDEAVLALSNYQLPDPLSVFYTTRGPGVSEVHLRSRVILADPDALQGASQGGAGGAGLMDKAEGEEAAMEMARSAPPGRSAGARLKSTAAPRPAPMAMNAAAEMDAVGGQASADTPIALRTDFRALAIFAPRVITDASGTATVPVELPDNLTRYRVMAVAVDNGVSFGSDEANVTARKPLMLRPSPPRFLNVGDKAELPFVVQNPTGSDVTVELALRVDNAKILDSVATDVLAAPDVTTAGLRFVVPAEDRREVRVPVGVIDAGTLRFQAVVASRDATDAATDDLPVWTPATTEAFATYGTIDRGGIVQPVKAPDDAWPQYGGLEITTSSTQLQALTDAVLYLNQYPYECSEQIASRVLANAALRDVLDAFEADGLPPAEQLRASVESDMARLKRRQLRNGGFSFWGRSRAYPFPSLHVTHSIVRAKDKGWTVDEPMLARALDYAKNIDRHIPAWYSERARVTIQSYAVYVRHRAGDDDLAEARRLYKKGFTVLPLEAQAWILPTLSAKGASTEVAGILRNIENKATETAAAATFSERYTDANDYVLLHGTRRTDGVILESLLEVRPKHDLIVKVVVGLLGHRVKGRWSTTQENSFVLLAMDRYFRVYEGVTPDFVARAWMGDGFIGEHTFKGRTTERSHIDVPMAWMTDPVEERNLTLAMEGEGRLYYRIGLRYAPKDLELPAADHGFTVERTYEAVDDETDVQRDPDGTWRIKAGARVRARVTMVAPSRRTMVALVDPLPGGFEPMNAALAVTGDVPADPQASQRTPYWWWSRPWYSHQNLRDERAEAFTNLLWAGVHEYSYVSTATTPGRFVVPPAKAEEMYHPETFGRSAGDKVVIE